MLSDQEASLNSESFLGFGTAFEQYVDLQHMLLEKIVGAPADVDVGDLPLMSEVTAQTRMMRLLPKDYEAHECTSWN